MPAIDAQTAPTLSRKGMEIRHRKAMAVMAAERSGGILRVIKGCVREMLVGYDMVRNGGDPQTRMIGANIARNARQDWFRCVGWPTCPPAPKASQRPIIDLPGVLSQAIAIAEEEQSKPGE